jgi:hypothetical protein
LLFLITPATGQNVKQLFGAGDEPEAYATAFHRLKKVKDEN